MVFVFGSYTRRGLAQHQNELLQGKEGCLRCGRRVLCVVETRRTCHWCFIPLFPLSIMRKVVCTGCNLSVDLPYHILQASASPQSAARIPIPVAKRIVMDREAEPLSAQVLEVTAMENSESFEGAHEELSDEMPLQIETTKNATIV